MTSAAIIVASGNSRRMGFDKLAASLAGKSVLRRSVEAFQQANTISKIIVVCPRARFEALLPGSFGKELIEVEGGLERHH